MKPQQYGWPKQDLNKYHTNCHGNMEGRNLWQAVSDASKYSRTTM